MSQSLSRRSFLKYAGSGAVSLAAALLTGVSGAALADLMKVEGISEALAQSIYDHFRAQ